jgi:hypothetical protein
MIFGKDSQKTEPLRRRFLLRRTPLTYLDPLYLAAIPGLGLSP